MPSTNFTYADAIQAVRTRLNDAVARRYNDSVILNDFLPGVLQQLRADRPDLWLGQYGTENFKPSQTDPVVFDDMGYQTFVDALHSAVEAMEEESVQSGVAGMADGKSERARKS